MKTLKALPILAAALLLSFFARAGGSGSITGLVTDSATGKPVVDAIVTLECQGKILDYVTGESGYFYASNIPTGKYDAVVSYQMKQYIMRDLVVRSDQTIEIAFNVVTEVTLPEIVIVVEVPKKAKLFDPLDPTNNEITDKTIATMPAVQKTEALLEFSGVLVIDDQAYVRGSRDGSIKWVIDDCPVMGGPSSIPLRAVQSFRMYAAFVPAKYGDTVGGIAAVETKSYFDN
jgi:hypothetical protein